MSDLRDITLALAAFSSSLSSIEQHVAEAVANGAQHREGMHALRNQIQEVLLRKDEADRVLAIVEKWIPDFGKKLGSVSDDVGELKGRFEQLSDDVVRGFRQDRAKLRELEDKDEVTQA
jgi:hypothetical protein